MLSTTTCADARIVTVTEARIDAAATIRFKDEMRAATENGEARVVLDLSGVDFVDSSGLGAIVTIRKLLGADRGPDLVGLTPNVSKVFRLTRMDTVFEIYDTLDAALLRPAPD